MPGSHNPLMVRVPSRKSSGSHEILDEKRSDLGGHKSPRITLDNREVPARDVRSTLFDKAMALAKSKGYKAVSNSLTGIDMIVSKPIELQNQNHVLDVLPFKFHYGDRIVRVDGDSDSLLKEAEGRSTNVNTLYDEFVESVRKIASNVLTQDLLMGGVQNNSARLVRGKASYVTLNGKSVSFWVNPVFLTSSKLESTLGVSKAWVSVTSKLGEYSVDVVQVAHLSSYLEFREKEVRVLGNNISGDCGRPGDLSGALRLFKLLTCAASLALLCAFFIYSSRFAQGASMAQLTLAITATVEIFGLVKLLRSYRNLQMNNPVVITGPGRITPEQVVVNEGEFSPKELQYLYAKYGGGDLSRLRKRIKQQRIGEFAGKAMDAIISADKLRKEELYSEAVLSFDNAIRFVLNASILSIGFGTGIKEVSECLPHLEKILPGLPFQDILHLSELRHRINRGYDASREETDEAKGIARTVMDEVFGHLERFFKNADMRAAYRKRYNSTSVACGDLVSLLELENALAREFQQ